MNSQCKMIIFDMDGVILDSEPLHETARQMMYQKYGVTPRDSFPDPVGMSAREFWQIVGRAYDRTWDHYEMEEEQFRLVAEQVEDLKIPPSEGFIQVAELARREEIKIGLASSSARMLVDRAISALSVKQYFDVVVSGDEVEKKKPAPDVYEKVLRLAGVSPEEAVAVEDSAVGVDAAKNAGIYCYGYRNETSGQQDLSRADEVIESLTELLEGTILAG